LNEYGRTIIWIAVWLLGAAWAPAHSSAADTSRLIQRLEAGRSQVVVTYGTSLTAGGNSGTREWVGQFQDWLNEEYPGRVKLINSGIGGASSANGNPEKSGLDQLQTKVLDHNPDTVFIEFAINDAYLAYGPLTIQQSKDNLNTMIDRILQKNPQAEIILQTMNPVWDEPGHGYQALSRRPNLAAYYQGYREVAAARGLLLIDHYPHWTKLFETDRPRFESFVPDGVHPNADGYRAIVLPELRHALKPHEGTGPMSALSGVAPDVGREILPNDPALQYRGCARVDVIAARARFDRLVDAAFGFRYDSSGVQICFRTDATSVVARFRGNQLHTRRDAVNGVGVLFVDGTRRGTYNVDGAKADVVRVPVLQDSIAAAHNIEICLPYGDALDFAGLTVNAEARFFPVPARARPRYVAYGDSITHGFRASDVTKTYPFLLAARKDWELINMGFGSREVTAADGAVLSSLSPGVVTILMGFNDYYHDKPLHDYECDLLAVIRNTRDKNPGTPIFLITPLWSTEPLPTKLGLCLEDYRKVVRNLAAGAHDPCLHLVEGLNLIPHDPKYFTDGIHPNDEGFREMATNLEREMNRIHGAL